MENMSKLELIRLIMRLKQDNQLLSEHRDRLFGQTIRNEAEIVELRIELDRLNEEHEIKVH